MKQTISIIVLGGFFVTLSGCNTSQQTNIPPSEGTSANAVPPETSTASLQRNSGVPNGQTNATGVTVPKGFKIEVFAGGLNRPRRIAIAPGATPEKYDVFVSEGFSNQVRILRETNGDGKAESSAIFADGLTQPYGLAFSKNSLYVANTDAVVKFAYSPGQTKAKGTPQKIATLTADGYNQHWTRNLLFSRDGQKLYVTVGSSCNTCEEDDPQRSAISVMKPDGSNKRLFATGMRNPVGMALRPGTDELWTVVNERDNLGDDIPPDYLTRAEEGKFYGWPYAYTDIDGNVQPDPSFGEANPDKVKQTRVPDVPVQAHSAALGVAFYPVAGANLKFPKEYQGDAFLAYHGSWNRSAKTGYKIVRVDFQNGKPASVTDFAVGFLKEDGEAWGRPVDVHVAPDGSLLFSDDGGGKIWRISYQL